MIAYGPVTCALDLSSPGKRAGHFDLSHSDNRHAFSAIRTPLGVIFGIGGDAAEAPVALVCAGNHGDEYEGQIIVRRLFERLAPDDVTGGLILAPALNMPAVRDAGRVSPLDGGNLNRSFPGVPNAGPTCAIAGFVAAHLMPRADLAIDIHSGGSGLDFLDSAYLCLSGDPARDRRTRTLAEAMALPHAMVVPPHDTAGDFDSAAHHAGCDMLSCELGGEGKISIRALAAGWQGVLRVLAHRGIITTAAAARLGMTPAAGTTRFLDFGAGRATVTAEDAGLVEPLVAIGTHVRQGETLALLRDPGGMDRPARPLIAPVDGIVAIRRRAVLVQPGDHIFLIAPEMAATALPA